MKRRSWSAWSLAALLIVGQGAIWRSWDSGPLCSIEVRSYGQLPVSEPVVTDGSTLRVDEHRSVFLGSGQPLGSDYQLGGMAGVVEQVGTTFAWTERRCGRETDGYRFVMIRAMRPGTATLEVSGRSFTLHVAGANL